jgi:two-component system response regulator (stage 0 sporulation protein F)
VKSLAHILVVDDEMVMRSLLSEVFEGDGYRVTTAEDGRSGLDRFCRHPIDLVISDTHMPVMDGPSFIRALRAIDPTVPVIVMNSFPDQVTSPEPSPSRISARISKPFDLSEMRQAVNRFGH